jgi:CO/xanthine dehydrogenase Mo-binding subunit
MACSRCVAPPKPMCRRVSLSPSRPSLYWRKARSAMSASRSRWLSLTRTPRHSTPPSRSWSTTTLCGRFISAAAARAPDAPQISPQVRAQYLLDWRAGDIAAVDAAFAAATHVVRLDLDNHRIVTNPMEPRGVIGLYDPVSGRYTAHVSSQSLHSIRDNAARALGVPPGAVRFVAPDVGGGFGVKNFIYPEHVLILWAAKRVGRPVKWIASRGEGFSVGPQSARPSGRGRSGTRRRGAISGIAHH